jgi:hypothetical protein
VCNILGPLFLGYAANAVREGDLRKACLAAGVYCLIKFVSPTFRELQSMAYLSVKQAAYIEIAQYTFVHLHRCALRRQSLDFRLVGFEVLHTVELSTTSLLA